MSTIYWKFKNTKSEFSSITFDSTHVSILDLKRAIIKQKKLQQTPQQPFDLSIINAHTGVEYTDETGPIPRNLAVIVRRLPAARNQHKKLWAPLQNNSIIATADNISKKQIQTISERLNHEFGPALFNDPKGGASGGASAEVNAVETETMNIIDMMNRRMNNGTTTVTDGGRNNSMMRSNRMNNRHHHHNNNMNGMNNKDGKQSYRSQRGDPPPGYICHRCHVSGHWIQDCPTNGDPKFDKKNRAHTLRSNLPVPKPATPTNISGDTTTTNIPTQQVIVGRKCYQIPTNVYESFNGDHSKIKAYIEISSGTNGFSQNSSQGNGAQLSRYKCEICANYYVDARFTPCCRVTYCNECIRQKSLFECPSMIKCPSCEEIFSSEALDTAQNTKLQEKVNKIVAQQKQQKAKMNLSSTDIPTTTNSSNVSGTQKTTKTIHIPTPHTITIPQPQIMGHNITAKIRPIRPTVILQQSPPSTIYKPVTVPPPTMQMQNAIGTVTPIQPIQPVPPVQPIDTKPVIAPIDTTRFEAPKNTLPSNNMNYVCIECNERGHKYKDCPKVAEKRNISMKSDDNSEITIKSENKSDIKSENMNINTNTIQSLKDDGLDRIPKKTANDIAPPQTNTIQKTVNVAVNKTNTNTSQNMINSNLMTLNQQRIAPPQVQLINNSAASALTTLSAINSVNMMNMRNRMNLNNILMNAALHNAQRRTGGISPRLINSTNPLLNPALALGRMSNARALLQQQSLLSQQAAFNRLRTLNNLNQLNTSQTQITNTNVNNFSLANIPQELLQSVIHELKQVMSSSDSSAVTNAINNAFVKLGAVDPDSKRLVLQQLVATISNVSAAASANNQKNNITGNVNISANHGRDLSNNMSGNRHNNSDLIGGVSVNSTSKKSKKKHKKSKSKKSKKKHKKSKSSKERKHKHSKRRKERERERRERDKKDRSRSRDRGRSVQNENESDNEEYNTNSDLQENEQNERNVQNDEDENTVIHVMDVQSVNSKKRKLPPAPMPDFTISPPPESEPKPKRQKLSNSNSNSNSSPIE